MNIKELIEKVKSLNREIKIVGDSVDVAEYHGIKQTVEVVDMYIDRKSLFIHNIEEDWQKLKELSKKDT